VDGNAPLGFPLNQGMGTRGEERRIAGKRRKEDSRGEKEGDAYGSETNPRVHSELVGSNRREITRKSEEGKNGLEQKGAVSTAKKKNRSGGREERSPMKEDEWGKILGRGRWSIQEGKGGRKGRETYVAKD